jgi:[acyl-carrier-protein] S-malonyltransferase
MCITLSGQGSQFVGMGKDLYDRFPAATRQVYDEVDEALNMSLQSMIFSGDQVRMHASKQD